MVARLIVLCLFAQSVSATGIAQEVVFSRRLYVARGQSFQQLWMWSPETGRFTQLTHSARSHDRPSCTTDKTRVLFESPAKALFAPTIHLALDVRTGTESLLRDQPPVARVDDEGRMVRLADCDDRTLTTSPDGSRLACTSKGEAVAILDRASEHAIQRIPFQQRTSDGELYPPWPLEIIWSPDGRRLLVGTYGEQGSSTSFQLDYFVLDLATEHWVRAFTGTQAVWLDDNATIVFSTPRDLAPLPWSPQRQIWVAHLARYDLKNGTRTPMTSGLTNDVQPTVCPGLRQQSAATYRH